MSRTKSSGKYKYILGVMACSLILLAVIVGVFSIDNSTNKMIVDYIESLGWEIEPNPREITYLTIPEEFDVVYETYNAIQSQAGFDFEKFRGERVSRYTYRVLNHKQSSQSTVIAGVFVFENNIIGGEISSAEMNGFMHSITETSNIRTD